MSHTLDRRCETHGYIEPASSCPEGCVVHHGWSDVACGYWCPGYKMVNTIQRRTQASRAAHEIREFIRMEPRLHNDERESLEATLRLLDIFGLEGL